MRSKSGTSELARRLRKSQTDAEGLLWSLLRSKQVCDLKFRRQHPIGPYFADFACQSHHIVIELDGDYHDHIQENDLRRMRFLESQGWRVIRFPNEDVLEDAEAVAREIARQRGLSYSFRKRTSKWSGMMSGNAASEKSCEDRNVASSRPSPAATASDLPATGG
mgnify:CR=1 FL=1